MTLSKKIVICGASGMVGTLLSERLHENGHSLILVGRDAQKLEQAFPFQAEFLTWDALLKHEADQIGIIINLSGAGVSDKKWTPDYKKIMRESRLQTTQKCVEICQKNSNIWLINASAVSAYGFYDYDHAPFTEGDTHKRTGTNFLQELIDDWEASALKAEAIGNRVTLLRTGIVLDRSGGGLPAMAKPYAFFMGGPVGTGEQVMSWISLRDVVSAIKFIIGHSDLIGPVNLVSPGSCQQKVFAKALGKALKKPSAVHMPAFMIKTTMGQMGEELVLTGQRVTPSNLLQSGFQFQDTDIDIFLETHYNSYNY